MPTSHFVEHFFRHEYARLVAALTKRFGVRHWALVEDAVQTAMQRALATWAHTGAPPKPGAWLYRVAYHRALDELRRDTRSTSLDDASHTNPAYTEEPADDEIEDAQLRMIFVCCDPAIAPESQVALALKVLCGFSVSEIAKALLTSEMNIAKRLTRAKERLREAGLDPAAITPEQICDRLTTVQAVLYLLFNEGYCSTTPDAVIRQDLCEEAVRLAAILADHALTRSPATAAFLALLLFHAARLEERIDAHGMLILMDNQDRRRWDYQLLGEAYRRFQQSTQGTVCTRYHVEAWIAAEHCRAASAAETDWQRIVEAYDLLLKIAPSPIHELNRAIAIGRRDGPHAALRAMAEVPAEQVPANYYLWYAAHAQFAHEANDREAARRSLVRARELAPTIAEQRLLEQRLAELNTITHAT
jgi:RNA polymerase sigma-70 factor (ECF subfamily)